MHRFMIQQSQRHHVTLLCHGKRLSRTMASSTMASSSSSRLWGENDSSWTREGIMMTVVAAGSAALLLSSAFGNNGSNTSFCDAATIHGSSSPVRAKQASSSSSSSALVNKQENATTKPENEQQQKKKSAKFQVKQSYEIEDVLGEGGFGQVFLARRKTDGQRVALKAMPRKYTNDQGFQREVLALQRLSTPPIGPHPHICQLFDLHADDKHYYLAMELIEGGELFERLIQDGPYSEAKAASFLRQFAEALCSVHGAGLTHGDLKPENLLLSSQDYQKAQLKLVDFGCAVEDEKQAQDFSGTPFYWPPELFGENARMTPAADLWAAGVIVYIVLTGSHPLDRDANATDEEIELTMKRVRWEQEKYNTHHYLDSLVFDDRLEGLSDSCLDLMHRLMHPDPTQRMTSDEFRRHPWVQGLTASWKKMEESHNKLKTFWRNRFRAEIMKKFAASIVGLTEDEEGIKSLSQEHLTNMFHTLDLKKNGVLELEEMQQTFRSLGVSEQDISDIFQSADIDGSGVIHFDEFCALMKNGKLETFWQDRFRREIMEKFAATLGISGKDVLSEEDLEKIFSALDLKKNNVLELEEIEATLLGLGVPKKEIEQIFSSADLDGSGVIHLDEFKELMKKNVDEGMGLCLKYRRQRFRTGILKKFGSIVLLQRAASQEERLREMFDAIDLDGNGYLDANELRVLLRSVGESEDLISRIVASVDSDQDGGLTWEDFVEVMRTNDGDEHHFSRHEHASL